MGWAAAAADWAAVERVPSAWWWCAGRRWVCDDCGDGSALGGGAGSGCVLLLMVMAGSAATAESAAATATAAAATASATPVVVLGGATLATFLDCGWFCIIFLPLSLRSGGVLPTLGFATGGNVSLVLKPEGIIHRTLS